MTADGCGRAFNDDEEEVIASITPKKYEVDDAEPPRRAPPPDAEPNKENAEARANRDRYHWTEVDIGKRAGGVPPAKGALADVDLGPGVAPSLIHI